MVEFILFLESRCRRLIQAVGLVQVERDRNSFSRSYDPLCLPPCLIRAQSCPFVYIVQPRRGCWPSSWSFLFEIIHLNNSLNKYSSTTDVIDRAYFIWKWSLDSSPWNEQQDSLTCDHWNYQIPLKTKGQALHWHGVATPWTLALLLACSSISWACSNSRACNVYKPTTIEVLRGGQVVCVTMLYEWFKNMSDANRRQWNMSAYSVTFFLSDYWCDPLHDS